VTLREGSSRSFLGDVDRRHALKKLLGTGAAWLAVPALAQPATATPPLSRGVNLTHWFEYEQGQVVSAAEMLMLRQAGFDHVRLPVDPVVGGWRPEAGARLAFLPVLRAAIEQAIAAGLAVVLDLHLEPATKQLIQDKPETEKSLVALWSTLARHFSDLPVSHLALELFNEPQYYGWSASRWPALQQRLLEAVRQSMQRHLILLSGNEGGSLKGLRGLPLVRDPAVAYTFHYYDPFLFTHQGAHWLDTRYTTAGLYRGVRYPAQYQIMAPARLTRPHDRAAREMADYLEADWGPARIRADMDAAGQWARQQGVRLLCTEFGAIRANVDVPSRYRWMQDVRTALEANRIGWTVWDYTDIFGLTAQSAQAGQVGQRQLESEAVRALGLGRSGVKP
jgi:endoglucanase